MTRLAIAALAAAVSLDASAALYKCIDASGRTTYSELPCPGAKSQQRMKTESDLFEGFVHQLQAITNHGDLTDVGFMQRTLGVTFSENEEKGNRIFQIATTPPGSPIQGGYLQTPASRESPNDGSFAEFRLDSRRCVSQEMVTKVFGAGESAQPQHATYFVQATARVAVIELRAQYSNRAPHCAEQIHLIRASSDGSSPAPRRGRRR